MRNWFCGWLIKHYWVGEHCNYCGYIKCYKGHDYTSVMHAYKGWTVCGGLFCKECGHWDDFSKQTEFAIDEVLKEKIPLLANGNLK